MNDDGLLKDESTSFAFTVLPHFHQTFPFRGLVGLVMAGAGVAWNHRRQLVAKEKRDNQTPITGQLLASQEAERGRIARELHDDLCQRLARLAIDAGRIEKASPSPAERQALREVKQGLVRLSEDVHSISYRLHPSILVDLGLIEALRAEVDRLSRRNLVEIQFRNDGVPDTLPRVLLADDHRLVAEGLKSLLTTGSDLLEVVEDGRARVEAAIRLRPEVVIVDISMPKLNGIDALIPLRRDLPDIKVIFLTMHTEVATARRAMETGAQGDILKHSAPTELLTAIRAALSGHTYITPAMAGPVLQAMRQEPGQAKDPAAMLRISTRTVEFHTYQMMESLDIHTNAELIHFALKHGIVTM